MRNALALAALAVLSWGTPLAHAAPPPVLGDAVVPNPAQLVDAATQYLNAVSPGSGQMVGQGKMMLDQAGVDSSAPIYLVVFDPKAAPEPVLVVFKEKDAKQLDTAAQGAGLALRRVGGLVLAAKKPLLDKIPDALVKELVSRPLPSRPTARVYVPRVYAAFKKDIEDSEKRMSGGPMGESLGGMMKMVWGFFKETQSLSVELEVSAAQCNLFISLGGKPGSILAKLGAGAKGSEFRLAPALVRHPMVGGGTLDLSSMAGMWDGMAEMSAKMVGADPKELAKAWRGYSLLFSGEAAYGMTMKSPTDFRVAILSELKDPAGGLAAWEASMTALASGKKPWFKVERAKGAFKDGSVVADEISLLTTPNFPVQNKGAAGARVGIAAVLGNQLVGVQASTAEDARIAMKELLASVRKPPAAPAGIAAAFADAKSRKESIVFFMDPAMFAAIAGRTMAPGSPPFAFGGSGAPDGVRLRLSAPAATVKALISGR